MKRLFYLLILSLLFSVAHSQEKQKNIAHYLFPEFTQGEVLMKKGVRKEALLNFNALTEEMIFESNGVKLAVAQLEFIDTIYINGRKFFPLNGKFLEALYHSKYDLYAEHKCSVNDPGKPAGYGTSSQLGAATTYSSYFSGNRVYEMTLPASIETTPFTIYWLKKDAELVKFVSLKQLLKEFPEKSSLYKKFIKEKEISCGDPESLIRLVKYMESN
jgi:hypothetical protein